MRAMWKGAVSFGLVNVPVRLFGATESHDVSFHQVRASDGSRIRYRRVAEADGEEVAYKDIAKGFQAPDGRMVVLTDEDMASLPTKSSREISVEKFVPADQIDPLYFDKAYYLEPDKAAVKPYALLREALADTDRMAVVTIAVRNRSSMAVLRVRDEVIVLQTMLWPDEVRAATFDVLDDVPEPKPAEVQMAHLLVESMSGDFDPSEYADDYSDAVEQLVQAKLEGGDVVAQTDATADTGEVVDLLAALQKSVDRAKASRGQKPSAAADKTTSGSASDDETEGVAAGDTEEVAPAKKTPAKKAAAKTTSKTTSTKTPAKKAG